MQRFTLGLLTLTLTLWFYSIAGQAAEGIEFSSESIGTVWVQPTSVSDFGYRTFGRDLSHWRELGPAVGRVEIPEDHDVRLVLNTAAAGQLGWTAEVPEGLVDMVEAYGFDLGDSGFSDLTHLAGLRCLSLSNVGLTSKIADDMPRLQQLQFLWIGSNAEVGDAAMAAIAALPELEAIGTYRTAVSDEGYRILAQNQQLRAVYAGYTAITDTGLTSLAQLPNLRAISLSATNPEFRGDDPEPVITNSGLASLKNCPDLEHLDINGSQVTDQGLRQLASDCPNLRRLSLDYSSLTSDGLQHLGLFKELEYLRCYGIDINDQVVEHFGDLHKLRNITGDLELSNAGVMRLASLPSLERLGISGKCDDACMPAVAAMPALKELSIQHTLITDEGFSQLANSTTLERVQITGNRMTTRCVETLATMKRLKHIGIMNVDPRADGAPVWQQLEELSFLEQELLLCECPRLEPDDIAKLSSFRHLKQLRIDGRQTFTDADLAHLQNLDHLEYLELTNSVITDEGLKIIGQLPALERLQINCLATEQGAEIVAAAPRLLYVSIGSPHLTESMIEQLRASHPKLVSLQLREFRLGNTEVSKSTSSRDSFWREGTEQEREQLNALEGKPAPTLAVTEWINSEPNTSLESLKGQVVLVEFWGTWCGPCRARMPEIRRLHEKYAAEGLVVIGMHSTNAADEAAEYVESNNITWAIGLDDSKQTSTAYEMPYWPSHYLIDRQGVLRMANPYRDELDKAIESLLQEE
ncbi:redoxin domain-containing protein [Aeoliella mucimassa]|uniref:Thiol-disulfide oxidoreductase ResA n=1 Tax=Aeoliella mucimassa TaxID=2527972 RepID=A0A518AV23_9BACT|nr:redoxin domain-containing protein [Aeoliella mucimassa]QDU58562.1 Thiol-disulfide oxidoreductase ResA [Aeoliella mucimassa]